tara:strand:+ start:116 stop:391 length:276 start_codon:yes stop_codon:yes gene_type:complete
MSVEDPKFSPFDLSPELENIGKVIKNTVSSTIKKAKRTNIFLLFIIVLLLATIQLLLLHYFMLKKSTLNLLSLIDVNKKNCNDIKDDQPWD